MQMKDDMNATLQTKIASAGRNSRLFLALGALCAMLLTPALSTRAQDSDEKDGDVSIGSIKILTVRFPAGDLTIKQRAAAITDRLTTILADARIRPSDIMVLPMGKDEAKIVVKDKLLVTVDSRTAQFNHTKAMDLGKMWADHLRAVLPQINAKPNPNETHGKN